MNEIDIEIKKVNWKHAEALCHARLIELGYETFVPFVGGCEVDLISMKEGKLVRIQVKSVSPTNKQKINVHTYRSSINFKQHKYELYKYIDWFLIYDGTNIYKIENKKASTNITLRYKLPKNNQNEGIRIASDYIF